MSKKNLTSKVNNLASSLYKDPFTIKKAIILFCYAEGILYASGFLLNKFNLSFGLIPKILYLIVVLLIAHEMGKNELYHIFAWRDIPLAVCAGILVMFYGWEIIRSEFANLFRMLLPVPSGFFDGWFYEPENVFLIIVSTALFPGFTEEVFFRGIIARRFYRTYSPVKAILLSSMLFGIAHCNPWQATGAFLGGCFYGWMYWRYRSIWLGMFAHAYHNILVTFMSVPYVAIENTYYTEMWRHPLWFDVIGLMLFGIGLLTIIVLSPQKDADAENEKARQTRGW